MPSDNGSTHAAYACCAKIIRCNCLSACAPDGSAAEVDMHHRYTLFSHMWWLVAWNITREHLASHRAVATSLVSTNVSICINACSQLRQECRKRRFLIWTRNNQDFYAGHSHKRCVLAIFSQAFILSVLLAK
eukprot:TRINITY_DN3682_c0_g4_i2.p3 TRINITY_DN3682_c0_g4~~TRINITY_DN3682_c0_g4_i2.p3  ORF type:complete len:132 (+),score=11.88 TRINITY_DN3682_c0_g4_i2:807-1202(+)